jgi:hypothetical protein
MYQLPTCLEMRLDARDFGGVAPGGIDLSGRTMLVLDTFARLYCHLEEATCIKVS